MRHILVDRIVWILASAWLLAVMLFAVAVTRAPRAVEPPVIMNGEATPTVTGAALFDRHCARCHTVGEAAAPLREAAELETEAAELRHFLDRHHAPSAEAGALIVNHLVESAGR